MSNLDQWRKQIADSLRVLIDHLPPGEQVDPTYGVYAAAILWPVRDAAENIDNRSALQSVVGDDVDTLLEIISTWGNDPVEAARQLSLQASPDSNLRTAIDKLLETFKDTLLQQGLLRPKSKPSLLYQPLRQLGRLLRLVRRKDAASGIFIGGSVFGANVVIGGSQYVAGDMVINVVIFRNWQQLALALGMVLGVILIVGGSTTYVVWKSQQPPWMDKDFNIAVAAFAVDNIVNPQSRQHAAEAAEVMQSTIYNSLLAEYGNNPDVQVERQNMGVVPGPEAAERLAEITNADMVIYGNVRYIGGTYVFEPFFYVPDRLKTDIDELIGEHSWLSRSMDDSQLIQMVIPETPENKRLQQETQIMIEFTKALTFLYTDQIDGAGRSIEQTRALVEDYATQYPTAEQETVQQGVVYVFASTIARLQNNIGKAREHAETAIQLAGQDYGRGYIALGNVFYEQGVSSFKQGDYASAQSQLASARDQYQKAADSQEDSRHSAFVAEKAQLALGNVYVLLYQMPSSPEQKAENAEAALDAFKFVTDSYDRQANTSFANYLVNLAAPSWYHSGLIQEWQGNREAATAAYEQVLALGDGISYREDAVVRLQVLQTQAAATQVPTP